jgi:hypothetical protein
MSSLTFLSLAKRTAMYCIVRKPVRVRVAAWVSVAKCTSQPDGGKGQRRTKLRRYRSFRATCQTQFPGRMEAA